MDSYGAVTVDLIFATLIILIVAVGVIAIASERTDAAEEAEFGTARMLAENVAEAINKVYAGGSGHMTNITLPCSIGNRTNYNITVNSSGVYIRIDGKIGKAYIAPKGISKNPIIPTNINVTMLPGNTYTIRNVYYDHSNWIVITQT